LRRWLGIPRRHADGGRIHLDEQLDPVDAVRVADADGVGVGGADQGARMPIRTVTSA
jgi:hypothetical protein